MYRRPDIGRFELFSRIVRSISVCLTASQIVRRQSRGAKEKLLMFNQKKSLARVKAVFQATLLLLLMGGLVGALGQTSTVGTISGTVRDQQGAVVPKAEVTITEERTGQVRTVKTNEDGFYYAPSLAAGRY